MRRSRVQWGAVIVTLVVLGAAAVFTVWRFVTPAGCAWVGPDPSLWATDHVVPRVTPDCELPPGQWVVGVQETDGLIRYQLSSGESVAVPTAGHPEPVLRRVVEGAITLAFTLAQFLVCVLLFLRRPAERPTGAALLLLVVLFPTPMVPAADRLRTRVPIAAAPLLVFGLISLTVGLTTAGFLALARYTMLAQLMITVFTLLVAGALVLVRMIQLRGDEGDAVARQQFLWVAGGGLAAALLVLSLWLVPDWLTGAPILPTDLIGLPGFLYLGAFWIAVARFRLFAWEGVLVWVLVHTALALVAVAVFAVVLLAVGTVWPTLGPATIAVLAVILVVAVASPIRDRIKEAVNFIVYRDPDDAYRTLSRVADELAGRTFDFARLAEDIRRALRIPRLAIRSERHTVDVGPVVDAPDAIPLSYPLEHGTRTYGALVVHSRGRGDHFSSQERTLLRDLARQIAVALHEETLVEEL